MMDISETAARNKDLIQNELQKLLYLSNHHYQYNNEKNSPTININTRHTDRSNLLFLLLLRHVRFR